MTADIQKKVVIVGGGAGGISVAARLCKAINPQDIAIIEPSETHDYQPMFTLVGGGVVKKEPYRRPEKNYIPSGVEWVHDGAATFHPENNQLKTVGGKTIGYDYLVAAPGIQLNWGDVKGLKESVGQGAVVSNYSYDTVDSTWQALQNHKGGTAIFTMPAGMIKCPGAPQKIMWLAEEYFRKHGVRKDSEVIFATAGAGMFGVPRYREPLDVLVKQRGVTALFGHNLIEVDAKNKTATFEKMDTKEKVVKSFEMIHVTPPQSAPDFVKKSPLAGETGWISVDQYTTRHTKYPNVFSLGDASSMPCSKTAAAIRKQAPVLVENLVKVMRGGEPTALYNGYASCPLVTSYNKVIMAEFGYEGKIMETFPFAQNRELRSMYFVKRFAFPILYWDFMLKGRA